MKHPFTSPPQTDSLTLGSVGLLGDLSGSLMETVGRRLQRKFRGRLSDSLLRRALDDAAEAATGTGFPHLFFPELAEEKVRLTSRAICPDPFTCARLRSAA